MRLGKQISKLILKRDEKQVNSAMSVVMSNKVAVNLNMLGVFMKDIIVGYLNGTSTVTK
ncbi:hypothetical protein LguiB_020423 [Lonicera macranthoides]